MEHYRSLDRENKFEFIDVSDESFDAHEHGRSQEVFMARLHVKDPYGEIHTGVDAFAVIWRNLPGKMFARLAGFIQLPGVHAVAAMAYVIFARIRPWLPSRRRCDDGCTRH